MPHKIGLQRKGTIKITVGTKNSNQNPVQLSKLKNKTTVVKLENVKLETDPENSQEAKDDSDSRQGDDINTETPDDAVFKCNRCESEILMTLFQFKMHYKVHHKGKRLPDKVHVPQHILTCEFCDTRFSTPKYLKEHVTNAHSEQYECKHCEAKFDVALEYVLHCKTHTDDDMFQCIYCDHKTGDVKDITAHLSITHGNKYRYTCKTCKKGFQSLLLFKEHDNFHTGKKPFVCELCGKSFSFSSYMAIHKMDAHREELTGRKWIKCDQCHKQYRYASALRQHMIKHTGNYPVCEVCGKQLSNREKLKFHMRIHTGEKPFKCSYCEKRFAKNELLREHTRIHTGERPFICEYCSKGFTQRSSLTIHTRSHTGEKPYVCVVCKRGFVSRTSLNLHRKCCDG